MCVPMPRNKLQRDVRRALLLKLGDKYKGKKVILKKLKIVKMFLEHGKVFKQVNAVRSLFWKDLSGHRLETGQGEHRGRESGPGVTNVVQVSNDSSSLTRQLRISSYVELEGKVNVRDHPSLWPEYMKGILCNSVKQRMQRRSWCCGGFPSKFWYVHVYQSIIH